MARTLHDLGREAEAAPFAERARALAPATPSPSNTPLLPDAMGQVVEFLSVDYHFENISRGVIDTRDLVFYLSLTVLGLLMTARTIQATRQ
jgi:hypothetical protein